MKNIIINKHIFFFALLFTLSAARAQYVAIPDSNFGKWLSLYTPSCVTGNSISGWQLDTTCASILNTTSITLSSNDSIYNLTGIQYFKNLDSLDLYDNNLTSLPELPSRLIALNVYGNKLTSLPALPATLTNLDCSYNQLNSLPPLPAALTSFACYSNNLTSLPSLPAGLTMLLCNANQLTSLPTLPAGLMYLECGSNQLNSLPTLPATIINLQCEYNSALSCLSHIYSDTLSFFDIKQTAITCLPNRFIALCTDVPNLNTMPVCDEASGCPYAISNDIISIADADDIHLYPNPNTGSFTLLAAGSYDRSFTITDMMGNLVTKQIITAQSQVINLPNVADGTYILHIDGSEPQRFEVVK